MSSIASTVKEFLLAEFLPGENPDELTETTPLISSGILDSLATLKLSIFLEESFGIKLDSDIAEVNISICDAADAFKDCFLCAEKQHAGIGIVDMDTLKLTGRRNPLGV